MEEIIIPQASLFLGIIPALILLYFTLDKFEGTFQHKIGFLMFFIGIVFGFITALVQSAFELFFIVYIFLIVIVGQLLKTIVLNLPRFHEKPETLIYGLTLGLGFGSTFTPFLLIAVSTYISSNLTILVLIGIASFGQIFIHGASGAYIGYGVYKNHVFRNLLFAILFVIPFNILTDLLIILSNEANITTLVVLVCILLLYSIFIYAYFLRKMLTSLKTTDAKRKRALKNVKNQ